MDSIFGIVRRSNTRGHPSLTVGRSSGAGCSSFEGLPLAHELVRSAGFLPGGVSVRAQHGGFARGATLLCVGVVVLTAMVVVPPANANQISQNDGNDVRGPLDMAQVTVWHRHDGGMGQTVTFETFRGFSNGQINGEAGYFELTVDTNGDRDPNMMVFVVSHHGRLRGLLANPRGRVYDVVAAKRVNRHAVSVKFPLSRETGSYDFAAFSAWTGAPCSTQHPCVDSIPNRYPLIRHDLTAPVTTVPNLTRFTSELSTDLPWPLAFTVRDDRFGSGVDRWVVEQRAADATEWVEVAAGTKKAPTVAVPGDEGTTYDLRVLAWDRQGNRSISETQRTTVPLDDTNAALTYSGTWVGSTGEEGPFRGTAQRGEPGAQVTLEVASAGKICVLGVHPPPEVNASAAMLFDGVYRESVFMDEATKNGIPMDCWTFAGETVSVELLVSGIQPFAFDGFAITHVA